MPELDRRTFIGAACAVCVTTVTTACGGGGRGSTPVAAPAATSAAPATASPDGGAAPLATLADIPVGGAVSATGPDGTKVIVGRPTATTVVAHNARCTHQNGIVAPSGGKLLCPRHGSTFDPLTGRVLGGPATAALAAYPVKVEGGKVVAT
jgi:cytochrome b6-f complex iron-sulfur subunit